MQSWPACRELQRRDSPQMTLFLGAAGESCSILQSQSKRKFFFRYSTQHSLQFFLRRCRIKQHYISFRHIKPCNKIVTFELSCRKSNSIPGWSNREIMKDVTDRKDRTINGAKSHINKHKRWAWPAFPSGSLNMMWMWAKVQWYDPVFHVGCKE